MTGKVRTPDWLETDWILGHFGKQRKRAVTLYIEFVAQGRGLESVWDEKIHPVILGNETYVESIYRHHVDETASDIKEISRLEQRRKNKPLVDYFPEGIDRGLGIAAAYSSGYYSQKVSVRWTHLALRVGEKLRTVDTQHGSNSLTVLVQICEVNTICQQVSDYLLQQGYEMCKVLIRVNGNDCRCVSKGH